MDPSATRVWLKTVLQSYRDSERTMRDVDSVLHMYNSLKPKMDTYTYDNGDTQLLLCLYGTIPITYRSAGYNIPVAFWIPSDFPFIPPIPYVKPTRDMLIRPGKYVDVSGLCYHPYRANWKDSPDQHNIVQLIAIFQQVFTQEPPVYAKPPNYQQPQISNSTQSPLSPGSESNLTSPRAHNANTILPTPTYPSPQPVNISSPQTESTTFLNILEGLHHITFSQRAISPSNGTTSPRPSSLDGANSLQQPKYAPIIPKRLSGSESQQQSPSQPSHGQHPIPPLPTPLHAKLHQKLSQRLAEFNLQISLEMDELLLQNRQLNDSAARIEAEKARLADVEAKLLRNNEILTGKIKEVEDVIEKAKQAPDVGVDEGVWGVTVVYNQLFDLVAEDNAIEDTIYYLGKALNSDKIELSTFMKHTRTLAKEQFQRRALIKVIRERIGFDDLTQANNGGWLILGDRI